ncbi:hypothetical protein P154DRAFT_579152 [Amniculicola lignicola CBS 123094]|uniref:F-box domain-containing protein n=1 Tax=Amniculicola lignicola CBS 123094 TaxID=1392246 RepID=A0A6A5W8Y8_9PLEO|nr:hypothetical protein P154DRAFT_579152 [Amniculicola lignicola CBS 123094]
MADIDDKSYFSAIPIELRLQIYDYLFDGSTTITISAARTTCFGVPIRDTARKIPIPGLPNDFAPLVRTFYDSSLVNISHPPTIPIDRLGPRIGIAESCAPKLYPPTLALMQTCRQMRDELIDYTQRKRQRDMMGNLTLHITYPYGILVLKELYPFLLGQATSVYISGYYKPEQETSPRVRTDGVAPIRPYDVHICHSPHDYIGGRYKRIPGVEPQAPDSLSQAQDIFPRLINYLFPKPGSLGRSSLQKFEARLYYPGLNTYQLMWDDDKAPLCQTLHNLGSGNVDLVVQRGRRGNFIQVKIKSGVKERYMNTTWNEGLVSRESVMEALVAPSVWGDSIL